MGGYCKKKVALSLERRSLMIHANFLVNQGQGQGEQCRHFDALHFRLRLHVKGHCNIIVDATSVKVRLQFSSWTTLYKRNENRHDCHPLTFERQRLDLLVVERHDVLKLRQLVVMQRLVPVHVRVGRPVRAPLGLGLGEEVNSFVWSVQYVNGRRRTNQSQHSSA